MAMKPKERLKKAGILSGNFWLTNWLRCQRTIFFLHNSCQLKMEPISIGLPRPCSSPLLEFKPSFHSSQEKDAWSCAILRPRGYTVRIRFKRSTLQIRRRA